MNGVESTACHSDLEYDVTLGNIFPVYIFLYLYNILEYTGVLGIPVLFYEHTEVLHLVPTATRIDILE
jgi:hypothetical protein